MPSDESSPVSPSSTQPQGPWQPSHAAQQRVWQEVSGQASLAANNSPATNALAVGNWVSELVFRGPLDRARLQAALDSLFATSENLKFTILSTEGASGDGPQRGASVPVVHSLLDLSQQSDPHAAYRSILQQSASQSFNLAEGSCQSQLLCIGPEEHIWLLVQHPLISDATTGQILARQLAVAFADSAPKPPSALSSQAEQLAFHQAYLAHKQGAEDLEFFRPRLLRTIEPHRFYNGLPVCERAINTLRQVTELNPQQLVLLEAHTSGPDSDSQQKLAAFFQTVLLGTLRRIGGNREQALGVPLRDASPPSGPCLGNFTHWAALWVEVEDSDTFASLAQRVREDSQSLAAHRRASLPDSDANDAPCFEVVCSVEREQELAFDALKTEQRLSRGGHYCSSASRSSSHVPALSLSVSLSPSGDACRLVFDFNAQRFTDQDGRRFVQHIMAQLGSALTDWNQPLNTAELLGESERVQLLALNPPPVAVGPDVIEGFEAQVSRIPDNRALLYGAESLSYRQLNAQANRMARALRAQGVQADDWVAIALERGIDLVSTLLACLKLGATYVPLDPSHPASRNSIVLEVAEPKVLLTHRDEGSELPKLAKCPHFCVEELLEKTPSSDTDSLENIGPQSAKQDRLAYVIFTSGSTGKPKGVQVPRATLANFLTSMQQEPGFTETDSLLSLTTISFDIAALELFLPLVSGGWLEIGDRLFALDPRALIKRLDSEEFTVLQATPATWRMLIEARWGGSKKLRALCGGEALPPALAAQLCERSAELWNMYGPTETTIWSTLEKVSPSKKGISIGHPIANTQVYILDEQSCLLPQGVVGELVIGGLGVARGYAGLPDLTAEKFVEDPFNAAVGARMYRTGDLGRWLADGTLECLGRLDFQVKIRGFRIELGEIETAIASHGTLPEALVVAKEVTEGNVDLVAYGKTSPSFDAETLRGFLKQRLPGYMVPAFFVTLDSWPLTHNGKIDRKALPAPELVRRADSAQDFEPPATELERRIAKIWCDTLNVPSVGRNEDLFDSGGNSLSAVRLLLGLAEMPAGEIALGTFLKKPTVRGVAEAIESGDTEERAVVVELNQTTVAESGEAPLFCICGVHLYSEIAHAMPERPVMGVYLPLEKLLMGLGKKENEPLPTLEEVAASYNEAVVKQQPSGPYFLSGLSFGGVIAFEMARQLRAKGETVELLAMFDSILPVARSFTKRAWAVDHARRGREEGPRYLFNRPGVTRRLKTALAPLEKAKAWITGNQGEPEEAQAEQELDAKALEEQEWHVRRMAQVAVFDQITEEYEPRMRTMAGDATFFRAIDDPEPAGIRIEGDGGWHRWLGGKLNVHELRGDHMGILQGDSAKKIAEVLTALAFKSKAGP